VDAVEGPLSGAIAQSVVRGLVHRGGKVRGGHRGVVSEMLHRLPYAFR
jgi:hypothetical protein